MDIRHKTRIIRHSKNITEIQEEVVGCPRQIMGEEEEVAHQAKDRLQLMDIAVDMIREEVARVQDIQMAVHQQVEEVAHHRWIGPLPQILVVSSSE